MRSEKKVAPFSYSKTSSKSSFSTDANDDADYAHHLLDLPPLPSLTPAPLSRTVSSKRSDQEDFSLPEKEPLDLRSLSDLPELPRLPELPDELQNPFKDEESNKWHSGQMKEKRRPSTANTTTNRLLDLPPLPSLASMTSTKRPAESIESFRGESPIFPEFPDIKSLKELDEDTLAEMFLGDSVPAAQKKLAFDAEERNARQQEQRHLAQIHAKTEIKTKQGPLFVNVAGFRSVLGDIDGVKMELRNELLALDKINEVKNAQDRLFSKLHGSIEDLERKLMYIDKVVFETKHY